MTAAWYLARGSRKVRFEPMWLRRREACRDQVAAVEKNITQAGDRWTGRDSAKWQKFETHS